MDGKLKERSSGGNPVSNRQNQQVALETQAAARWFCNRSDMLAGISWLVTIIVTVLGILLQNNHIIITIQICWFFGDIVCDLFVLRYLETGTNFKQVFDNYVFGWADTVSSFTETQIDEVLNSHSTWRDTQIQHRGNQNPSGVFDWYSTNSNDNEFESVRRAMHENVAYDQSLNKLLLFLMSTLLVFFLIVGICLHMTVYQLLSTMFVTFAVLSQKLLNEILNVRKVNHLNECIRIRLDSAKSLQDLIAIETIFYAKRLIPGTSSSLVYEFRKSALNLTFHKNV